MYFIALPPSFKKKPLDPEIYGAEGKNVTIKCNPEAAPKPKFIWKKDGYTIGEFYLKNAFILCYFYLINFCDLG